MISTRLLVGALQLEALLDDLALVHDNDGVRDRPYGGDIVRDVEVGDAELIL